MTLVDPGPTAAPLAPQVPAEDRSPTVEVVAGGPFLTDAGNWPVFLYLALVPTVIGHSLYALGLRTVTASVATLLSLLEPVVAAVLAVLVVGERLGVGGWAGIVLVVAGLSVLALPARRAG